MTGLDTEHIGDISKWDSERQLAYEGFEIIKSLSLSIYEPKKGWFFPPLESTLEKELKDLFDMNSRNGEYNIHIYTVYRFVKTEKESGHYSSPGAKVFLFSKQTDRGAMVCRAWMKKRKEKEGRKHVGYWKGSPMLFFCDFPRFGKLEVTCNALQQLFLFFSLLLPCLMCWCSKSV